jgi:hypothetical protein
VKLEQPDIKQWSCVRLLCSDGCSDYCCELVGDNRTFYWGSVSLIGWRRPYVLLGLNICNWLETAVLFTGAQCLIGWRRPYILLGLSVSNRSKNYRSIIDRCLLRDPFLA